MKKRLMVMVLSLIFATTSICTVADPNFSVETEAAEKTERATKVKKDGFTFTIPAGYTYGKDGNYLKMVSNSRFLMLRLQESDTKENLNDLTAQKIFEHVEQIYASSLSSNQTTVEKKTVAGKTAYVKKYSMTIESGAATVSVYLLQSDKSKIVAAFAVGYPSDSDYSEARSVIENATIATQKTTYISESRFLKYVKKHQHKSLDGKEKYVKVKVKRIKANQGIYKTDGNSMYILSSKGRLYYITNLGKTKKIKKGQILKLKVYATGSANGVSTIANAYIGF